MNLFGTPLGVRLPVEIPQRTIPIASGDIIVLHSDGIYETTSADGEDYGLERLEAIVRTGAPTAEELRDAILRNVAEFRGSGEAADDVTVVVCRMLSGALDPAPGAPTSNEEEAGPRRLRKPKIEGLTPPSVTSER